jgi:hypothetical protein
MPEKKYYSPQEAVDFLNEKLKPEQPLNVTRLARLRREKRIKGDRVGNTNNYVYTPKALELVTLADLRDKRKITVDIS